ncbi:MAG TPA: hypothetical protein VH208_12570, partial [Myxococcaceae bacterium]|nr:hypothetical protein [Myxococcaceae bacterium]
AFRVGAINFGVIAAFVALLVSPLGRLTGTASVVLSALTAYAFFSFSPAIIGSVLALRAFHAGPRYEPRRWAIAGLASNGLYLAVFLCAVGFMWRVWLGV